MYSVYTKKHGILEIVLCNLPVDIKTQHQARDCPLSSHVTLCLSRDRHVQSCCVQWSCVHSSHVQMSHILAVLTRSEDFCPQLDISDSLQITCLVSWKTDFHNLHAVCLMYCDFLRISFELTCSIVDLV